MKTAEATHTISPKENVNVPRFHHREMTLLTLALITFACIVYFATGLVATGLRAETRVAISALSCWIPVGALVYRQIRQRKRQRVLGDQASVSEFRL